MQAAPTGGLQGARLWHLDLWASPPPPHARPQLMPGLHELCAALDTAGVPRGLITRNVKSSIEYFHDKVRAGLVCMVLCVRVWPLMTCTHERRRPLTAPAAAPTPPPPAALLGPLPARV